jgi:hypothetical protein
MVRSVAAPASFRIVVPAGAPVPDITGVWQPVAPASAFSAAGAGMGRGEAVWSVGLPADASAAAAALDARAARLDVIGSGLTEASRRLVAFVGEVSAGPALGASFVAGSGDIPERELAVWLAGARGGVSSARWGGRSDGLGAAAREARAFLAQVAGSWTGFARVETSFGGAACARTRVGWLGDFETVWPAGIGPDRAGMHRTALALALATRTAWLRLAQELVGGGVRLGALIAGPGGWLLAVPAAWRFVRRVLDAAGAVRVTVGA